MIRIVKISQLTKIAYWTGVQALKCKLSSLSSKVEYNFKQKSQEYSKQQILGILYHDLNQDKTEGRLILDDYDSIRGRLQAFTLKYEPKFNFKDYPALSSWDEVKQIYSSFFDSMGMNKGRAKYIPERSISTPDGILTGQPDLMIMEDSGISIVEYKSGSLYDEDNNLKKEYVDQLHYYAYLLYESSGHQISHLFLKSMKDGTVEIQNSTVKGEFLAESFRNKLDEINALLAKNLPAEEIINLLAEPNPEICQYCDLRGCCPKFPLIADTLQTSQVVTGRILSTKLENKHFYGQAEIETSNGMISIHNIPRGQIHRLKNNDLIIMLNLKKTAPGTYEFTTFSKVSSYE